MNNNLINAEDLESSILGENKEFDSNDGIGILVDMAKQGKIDPWHIDILDVRSSYSEGKRVCGESHGFQDEPGWHPIQSVSGPESAL